MPNIPTDSCDATTINRSGRDLISFGGCNYLGLAHDPRVIRAVQTAAQQYGLSSSASRETTGNTRPHADLEASLTEFCGHQSGLLVPDGYIANLAALQGLEHLKVRYALLDERAHASLRDAAVLGGMELLTFNHLDPEHATDLLNKLNGPCVIMTDSVFTTDGDLAPCHALLCALRPGDWLLLDDCHGFAVFGDHGRGITNALCMQSNQLIVTTTLAKGLGCAGGMVMGPHQVVEAARANSTAYRCTTPASPALVAGGLEALSILAEDDEIHQRLASNISTMRGVLRSLSIDTHEQDSAIFAFLLGSLKQMRRIEQTLLDRGVLLPLMAYPNGPAPVYFRLAVNAQHTTEQLDQFEHTMRDVLKLVFDTKASIS